MFIRSSSTILMLAVWVGTVPGYGTVCRADPGEQLASLDDIEPDDPGMDVEPEWDDDVEPPLPPDEDDSHEATMLTEDDPDKDQLEGEEDGAPNRLGSPLPPHGRADRPALPHIDIDLIHPGGGRVGQGAAQIDLSLVGEDLFLALNFGFVYVRDKWAIAPRLPIRFRLVDSPPKDGGVLRRQDWDEASDWMRLLAYFRYGHVGSPLYIRVGELTGVSLGHGTLVSRYYNNVNMDHYQGGIYTYFDNELIGGEVIMDNVLGPELVVSRVFTRPLNGQEKLPYQLRKLKAGISLGADFRAPLALEAGDADRLFTVDFRPQVLDKDALPLFGVDLEVPAVSSPRFDLVPYVDVNSVDWAGMGVHLGTFANVRFDPLTSWRTRLEVRYSGRRYEPNYVDPFYEIQRYWRPGGQTKLAWLRDPQRREGRGGVYVETEFRISGFMRAMLVYSNDRGPDNTNLLTRFRFPHLGPLRLNLFFARFGFNGHKDVLDKHNTVVALGGRYNFFDAFFVRFRVMNEWWLRHTADGAGSYETTIGYDVGFGLLLKL